MHIVITNSGNRARVTLWDGDLEVCHYEANIVYNKLRRSAKTVCLGSGKVSGEQFDVLWLQRRDERTPEVKDAIRANASKASKAAAEARAKAALAFWNTPFTGDYR